MTKVLIADSSKASLVMSSEVFKDKIPGSVVLIAGSGKEVFDILGHETPDICLVDFDLPDADGASLIVAIRKIYSGPILMTAYPDAVVNVAVSELLFHYNDCSSWVPKPVRFEALASKIDQFLIHRRRLEKRFSIDLDGILVPKASARSKKTSKLKARVTNMSISGALLKLETPEKLAKSQELVVSVLVPADGKTTLMPRLPKAEVTPLKASGANKKKLSKTAAAAAAANKKKLASKADKVIKIKTNEQKFKAEIAWISPDGQMGIRFLKLSTSQRKDLESFLRVAANQQVSAVAS